MRVARLLIRPGITRRKTEVAAGQTREAIAQARAEWRAGMTALAREKRVFIDKAASPQGWHGASGAPPQGPWRNTTFTAGLHGDRIDVLMLIEGAMDGGAFCARVERMRAPALRAGLL